MEKKRFQKIYIEIINTCNLKCSFCKESNRKPKVMLVKEFEEVISKVKSYTNLITLHVKGEPLMHPNLNEILKVCEQNDIFVNITTNGTLLLENIEILRKSKALRQINISLHSINKNKLKYEKSEEKYVNDIFEAVKILQKNNFPYISYRLWNLKQISENDDNKYVLKKLEKEYGIENLIQKAKENDFIKLYEKTFLNQDIEFKWPDMNEKNISEEGSCLGLRNQIAILSNGDIVPCCLDQNADIKLGNIFNQDIDDVINSNYSKEIIDGFEKNKLIHKLCKTCGFVQKLKEKI